MTGKRFLEFEFTCSGDSESFGGGSVGFDFRHFYVLLKSLHTRVSVLVLEKAPFSKKTHMAKIRDKTDHAIGSEHRCSGRIIQRVCCRPLSGRKTQTTWDQESWTWNALQTWASVRPRQCLRSRLQPDWEPLFPWLTGWFPGPETHMWLWLCCVWR